MKRYRDKAGRGGRGMRAATFFTGKVPGNIKFRVWKFRRQFLLVLQVIAG
jgi:hypothetical protein